MPKRGGIDVTTPPRRGRVVMLIDNSVDGDSRVQKSARSAAAAGWDVILIGSKRPNSTVTEWRIGDAEVRLLPVPVQLNHPLFHHRRSLRRPLAYPPRMTAMRRELFKARHADIRSRYAHVVETQMAGAPRATVLAQHLQLLPARLVSKVATWWVRLRINESRRLTELRADPDRLANRMPATIWRSLIGVRAWRRLDPALWSWELGFGRTIDELEPDIIHAHDFKMVGVGARARARARAKGRQTKFVYDAHEYVPGLVARTPRWLPAQVAHEAEYIKYADAVVTVSEALADILQDEHKLPERPTVVMNAPVSGPAPDEIDLPVPDLRELCGVGPTVPLLVYCGGITPVRGIDLMIEAMVDLPDVHVAFMCLHPSGRNGPADEAFEQATALGVADRAHMLSYVPHWQVAKVITSADAAVSPLIHLPNHEIALSNKFFEYSQARLPLIVSDVRTMADTVMATGQGEVFRAGDREDYVRAVRKVLADPAKYRAAYDKPGLLDGWTWEAQAGALDALYSRLHSPVGDAGRNDDVVEAAATARRPETATT